MIKKYRDIQENKLDEESGLVKDALTFLSQTMIIKSYFYMKMKITLLLT